MIEGMQIDRRGFLLGSAALAAIPAPSLAARPESTDIKLGVATYSFRDFQRDLAIKYTKELGVHYVDIKEFHLPQNDTPKDLAAGRKKFDSAGLQVIGGGNISLKEEDIDGLRKHFVYAKTCGFPMMIVAPSRTNMKLIEKLAMEYDMVIAVHNHGPEDAKFYPTPQSVLEIVKDMDPRMGLCIDIGHTARTGVDVVESIALAGPRLHEIHVKDLKDFKNKDSQVPCGDGIMPFPAIFKQLQKQGYTGVCSLEYEIDAESPMTGMQKSFAYMRGVAAGLKG
jgi:sugar phosphate isomerase/epimerase